jgi:F420H(2)-dependent quinone reductase
VTVNPLAKLAIKAHVFLYRATHGKRGARIAGKDVVLLTTTGKKSGQPRTVPVMCFSDAGDRIVIASNGGAADHPAWFKNLEQDPQVSLQLGSETYRAKAVLLEPAERERVWKMVVREAPQFAGYEKKTSRVIPVVRLVRAG